MKRREDSTGPTPKLEFLLPHPRPSPGSCRGRCPVSAHCPRPLRGRHGPALPCSVPQFPRGWSGLAVSPPLPQGPSLCVAGSLRCVRCRHKASEDPEGLDWGVDSGVIGRYPPWAEGALVVASPRLGGRAAPYLLQGSREPGAGHGESRLGFELCPMGRPCFQPWLWLSPGVLTGKRRSCWGGKPQPLACSRSFPVALSSSSVKLLVVTLLLSSSNLSFSEC